MQTTLITGSNGFIGRHIVAYLKYVNHFKVLEYDQNNTLNELEASIKEADIIVHLAGSNRPQKISEYHEVNYGLTDAIVKLLISHNLNTPIIFSSSIQAINENPYGESKKRAEDLLRKYSNKSGAKVYIIRLTNVFGKWCRPNYNSVVATFCNGVATDLQIDIHNPETVLQLIYVDDVIKYIMNIMDNLPEINCEFLSVTPIYEVKLGQLASIIKSFKQSRTNLLLPDVSDEFMRKLYTTYLSYLSKEDFKYELYTNIDERGELTELLKSEKFGQIFISTTKPGITRGNHYHHSKTEKFIVIKGKAKIGFRKIDEYFSFFYEVTGEKIEVIDIPPGYTHSITNIGDTELVTLFWSNEIFDSSNPDTFFLPVEPEN